jgi:hypothetical protein
MTGLHLTRNSKSSKLKATLRAKLMTRMCDGGRQHLWEMRKVTDGRLRVANGRLPIHGCHKGIIYRYQKATGKS